MARSDRGRPPCPPYFAFGLIYALDLLETLKSFSQWPRSRAVDSVPHLLPHNALPLDLMYRKSTRRNATLRTTAFFPSSHLPIQSLSPLLTHHTPFFFTNSIAACSPRFCTVFALPHGQRATMVTDSNKPAVGMQALTPRKQALGAPSMTTGNPVLTALH